ncbi:MAG: pyruvate kinase [Bacteroidota bacterium]|nr:pyruvate kinase [Bacteroidota bacterium]
MFDDSRTKIIATIGPASREKRILRKMFEAGVDVCRLNFSHGTHKDHGDTIKVIRELNIEMGTDVAILADLQGPKMRIGQIENDSFEIQKGEILEISTEEVIGTPQKVHIDYSDFAKDVDEGDIILIDDGKIKLEIVETDKLTRVKAKALFDGTLSSRKGVNLPNTEISLPGMTEKDVEDAHFAISQNVDWIALSFVRAESDVIELKQMIKRKRKRVSVIAKIEKPEAIEKLDSIIEVSDGIMIARGDLGVEIDFDKVPLLQKMIAEKCINASVPVIVATQMLESMVNSFAPTRAEANDVANAVLDGVDTLMLSGETAMGKYPVESIKSMHKIIQHTEKNRYDYNRGTPPKPESPRFIRDSICYSAAIMAEHIGAKAVVTFTDEGNTARTISGYRPKAHIFAFSKHNYLRSILSLLWGVKAFYSKEYNNIDNAISNSVETLKTEGFVKPGDKLIHVASTPLIKSHKTNMLKVSIVK